MLKSTNQNTSRREKVDLLKDLLTGKKSLKDTRPHKVVMWLHLDEFYSLEDGSLKLTEEEYKAYCSDLNKHYNVHHIIIEDYGINSNLPRA